MISLDEAKRLAKRTLSPKRYEHTLNVKKLAVELAKRNGVDEKKAALAALLHDIAKEQPKDELLQIITGNDIITNHAARRAPAVWHGGAAAVLAQWEYGVDDPEILSAIACHTTGKAGMSQLTWPIWPAMSARTPRPQTCAAMCWKTLTAAPSRAWACPSLG